MIGKLVFKMQSFFQCRNSTIVIGDKKYSYVGALCLIPFFYQATSKQKIYRKAKVALMVFHVLELLNKNNVPQHLYPLNLGFYEKLLFLWDSNVKQSKVLQPKEQEFIIESTQNFSKKKKKTNPFSL